MADYDLKSITADTDGPSADTELLFGSPDQSSGTPKPYSFAGIKTWIKSWSDALYLDAASDLSDLSSAITARKNLGVTTKFVAGRYYWPHGAMIGTAAAVASANFIRVFPFRAPYTGTISELFVRVQGASAGGNFECALYAADASTLLPTGNAIAQGAASGSTTTAPLTLGVALASNYQIQEGTVYWLAFNADNTTATFMNMLPNNGYYGSLIGDDTIGNMNSGSNTSIVGLFKSQTFGTWPDLTGATFSRSTTVTPVVGYKITSVP